VVFGSPEVLAGHGLGLSRGGRHGEHVVVRLHGRGVGCRRGEEWCGKLIGGRVEGVDKMQVEDALPIDGMMLREEEWRRDGERKRYRDASLGTVAAGDEL
jgi:hypothetical protein